MEFELPNGADAGFEPKYGRTASNGALERLESHFGAVFHLAWSGPPVCHARIRAGILRIFPNRVGRTQNVSAGAAIHTSMSPAHR